jgi:hypothetical protein
VQSPTRDLHHGSAAEAISDAHVGGGCRWPLGVGKQTKNQEENIMQFEVRSEEVANIETEKGVWRPRRLMMLGTGDFAQQFIEINLPENCPQIGVGKKIDIYLRKAMRLNNGTLQVSGDLKAIDGKLFTLPPQAKAA